MRDRIVDARVAIHVASRGCRELLPDSIPVVGLMDQIRRLPGSGSIRSGGDAYRPRLESTRSSSAGQIGVDGAAYGHKRSRSGLSAREESLPPPPSLFASFFPITFTRLLLLPFFLPENQSDVRCNARYEAPGRRPRRCTGCGQEARNFVKRVREITKRAGPAALLSTLERRRT